jgi:hypothetical protein
MAQSVLTLMASQGINKSLLFLFVSHTTDDIRQV